MAVTATVKVNVSVTETNPLDLGTGVFPSSLSAALSLTNGTGNGQVDRHFSDTRTVALSSSEDLDLNAVLTGAFGVVQTFARIKVVCIKAAAANTNNVLVSRPASNGVPIFSAAGDEIPVRPGGVFLWACTDATGVVVTGGTGDLLHIANSGAGTSVDYSVEILGCSA